MKPLIMISLLAFMQVAPPATRNPHPQKVKADSKKASASQNKPPTSPIATENPITSNNTDNFSKNKAGQGDQQNIAVTALPNVNVNKTRSDYIYASSAESVG
jgi:hypothetical protein